MKGQFNHLRDAMGSKFKDVELKFKTATEDMNFYVQNIEN